MYCSNCGNNVPDGSISCPICGFSLTNPAMQFSQPMNQQSMYTNYQQPAYQTAPKKSNRGLIVGISITALVIIAAIITVLVLVVFKKDDDSSSIPDGKYNIETIKLEGKTFKTSEISSMGYGEMYIRVKGDTIYFKSAKGTKENTYDYTYDKSSKTGEISNAYETLKFSYNDNKITVDFTSSPQFSSFSQYDMIFAK